MKQARISLISVIILCLLAAISRYKYPSPKPISWDVAGYYLYLPATFIYNDPGLENYARYDSLRNHYEFSSTFYQVYKTPKDKYMIKYTMGSAFLYAPFFGVAHVRAMMSGAPTDGFSWPYQQTLMWGMLLYVFLALLLARKILLEFFDDITTSISLMVIFLGTNAYYYLSLDNLQVHVILFFLYTLFIWLTIRFYKNKTFLGGSLLGLVGGLIILTRPTDIMVLAVPLLWTITSWSTFVSHLKSTLKYLPLFLMGVLIAVSPQLLYWKYVAGSWLVNSYNNPGEGLDLFTPHTINFLFSYRKGWLVYTPMAVFILLGVLWSLRAKTKWGLGVFMYFLFFLWITSSWTCWWYASSYSSRAMVQTYALGMLPLGFIVNELAKSKGFKRILGGALILLLVVFNLFQTWQFIHGILKPDRMTRAYYWRHFGSTNLFPESESLLLRDKYLGTDTIPNPADFFINNSFTYQWRDSINENEPIRNRLVKLPADSVWSLRLDSQHVFYTVIEKPYQALTLKNFAYISIEGLIKNSTDFKSNPVELVRTMEHKGKLYFYTSNLLTDRPSVDSTGWQYFRYDYVFPDVRKRTDKFKGYFWLRGGKEVWVRELKVNIWEERFDPSAL